MSGANEKDRSLAILIIYFAILIGLILVYRDTFMTIAAIVVMAVFVIQYVVPRIREKQEKRSGQS